LDSVQELGDGVAVHPILSTEAYASWADYYDEPGNQLIDLEQPVVREILDDLPPGVALDAACGTGRHSAYLASLGHTVIAPATCKRSAGSPATTWQLRSPLASRPPVRGATPAVPAGR
jgi:SAM-dependent methyltransferase